MKDTSKQSQDWRARVRAAQRAEQRARAEYAQFQARKREESPAKK